MNTDATKLARALDWVNKRLQSEPGLEKLKAVDDAAMKFDLGPLETDWLLNQLHGQKPG